jgi:ribonucleoside-diphosphate reductase subunit M2
MSIESATNKLQELSLKKNVDDEQEEILRENTRRFCLFPIKYHEVNKDLFDIDSTNPP